MIYRYLNRKVNTAEAYQNAVKALCDITEALWYEETADAMEIDNPLDIFVTCDGEAESGAKSFLLHGSLKRRDGSGLDT